MAGHALAAVLVALVLAQATPRIGPRSPASSALDQLTNSATRPVPTLPAPTGQSSSDVWVPDRILPSPDQPGGLQVPGHWERRISDQQYYVPPLTVRTPDGRIHTTPGGVLPPPEHRQTP